MPDRYHTVALGVTHRLVVPVAFLPELRAEQTTAILFEGKFALVLQNQYNIRKVANGANLPHNVAGNL